MTEVLVNNAIATTTTAASTISSTTTVPATTTTAPTTTISSPGGGGGGGGSGGGGGGAGGGGSQKPTVSNVTGGSEIENFTQKNTVTLNISGTPVKVTENYITPTSAGISIGNESFAISENATVYIGNFSGSKYYAMLTNVSYLPIQDTVKLKVFTNSSYYIAAPRIYGYETSDTTGNLSINVSSMEVSSINFTSLGMRLQVSSSNSVSTPAIIYYVNLGDAITAPDGLKGLLIENISVSSGQNLGINVTFSYPCNESNAVPYIFKNGSWQEISEYDRDKVACIISFAIPRDPIIGIFYNSTVSSTTSSTAQSTLPTTTIMQKASKQQSYYEYAATGAVIAVVAIAAYMYSRRKKKPGQTVADSVNAMPAPPHQVQQPKPAYPKDQKGQESDHQPTGEPSPPQQPPQQPSSSTPPQQPSPHDQTPPTEPPQQPE